MSEETTALLYAAGIYLIFFAVIVINYGAYAVTVVRWTKRPNMSSKSRKIPQPEMSLREKIPCYIPVYQVLKVYWTIKTSRFYFVEGVAAFACVGIVVNLINKFLFSINSYVMFACNIWMLVSVLIIMLLYGIITAVDAHVYDFSTLNVVLCFLFSVLWCWYLRCNIPNIMREAYKEEVFSEHTTNIRTK